MRKALTSLIRPAPALTAAVITPGFIVSMEIGISNSALIISMTGATRSISSCSATISEPGRVDSPPMSKISAPSEINFSACFKAASRSKNLPPSENESGVTLMMPIIRGTDKSKDLPAQSKIT